MKRTLVIFTAVLLLVLSTFGVSADRVTTVYNVPVQHVIGSPKTEYNFDYNMDIIHTIFGDGEDSGERQATVKGIYVAGSTAAEVISVDVSWGSMIFTYDDAAEGTWNDKTHEYDNVAEAQWSCEADANKITVINHSNTAVEAQLTFAAEQGLDVTGSFTESVGTANDGIMNIATAVGTTFEEAPREVAYFNIDSGTIKGDGKIGEITLKIVNK